MHLQEITLFDLYLRAQLVPIHHVTYASAKFEVVTSKGLREDRITRNVTDGQADRAHQL